MVKIVSTAGIPRDVMDENPKVYGWWGTFDVPPKEYDLKREAEVRRHQRKKLKRLVKSKGKGL